MKNCGCKGCATARSEQVQKIIDFLEERRYNFGIDSERYDELTQVIDLLKGMQ